MDKSAEKAAQKIFDRILVDIKPSAEEIQDTTFKVNKLTNMLAQTVPKNVEVRVAGSMARGTNLKGDADIDMFLLFPSGFSNERLVKLGLEYGKKLVKKEKGRYEIKYAEHPYIRLYLDSIGVKADIVPASKIEDAQDMKTAVDRTPLHTEFINSSLTSRQRDEVRMLKYLLKAHGIYGAEVKTGGFSGYMCELLIHHYGSLSKALDSVSKFKLPLIIEPRFKNEIHDEDLSRRFNSDFVVIDPVDKTRNAAAGVSHESLGRFVIVARQFVKKPSIDLFYRNRFSSTKVRGLLSKFLTNSGLDTFLIESKLPDKSEDITFPQLRKMGRLIVDHLERNGFSVYLSMPVTNGRRGIILLMAPKQILKSRMLKGPNVFVEDASHRFMEKHKGAMGFTVVDLVLYALEKSKYQDIKSVLRDLPSRLRSHKDINLSNAKVLVNKMPKELAVDVYAEILKKTTI